MRLYILRHGPAEDHAASGRDFDRALTPPGRERVRHVARALKEAAEMPLVIWSSPLVRAIETAEIVAAVGDVPVEVRRELSPDGPIRPLLAKEIAAKTDRIMLVGHEPDLAELTAHLIGRHLPGGLQKAMVVGLGTGTEPGRGSASTAEPMRLRFVLDPKSLEWHYRDSPHTS